MRKPFEIKMWPAVQFLTKIQAVSKKTTSLKIANNNNSKGNGCAVDHGRLD
jgi:hypothetical protein